MTEKEILAKAEKDYPPGTKFICANREKECIRSDELHDDIGFYWASNKTELLGMIGNGTGAWVYYNNKWATIIGPKQLPIFN